MIEREFGCHTMKCEHCGQDAITEHMDYGVICSQCLSYWERLAREYQCEQEGNALMVERMMRDFGFRPME